eukprot:9729012-Alexandrium_andersonii.AAC.1
MPLASTRGGQTPPGASCSRWHPATPPPTHWAEGGPRAGTGDRHLHQQAIDHPRRGLRHRPRVLEQCRSAPSKVEQRQAPHRSA